MLKLGYRPRTFLLGPLRHFNLLGKYSIVKLNVSVGLVRPRRTQKTVESGCRLGFRRSFSDTSKYK